ncbi:MAG: tRNA 2-thiouridine(34) synthase MnmA [Pirellulales bacterium]|jgi:tRNA-specific 2-thiouridylase
MSRIVIAMSGGVDSSVAAALLVEAGHECIGVFMRHGQPALPTAVGQLPVVETTAARPGHQGCCSVSDAVDARRVADRLDIPLYPLDLTDDFEHIIDSFAGDYAAGRTPNPCVRCNQWIKFGRLFDHANAVGASHVATGHYARLLQPATGGLDVPELHRGADTSRDQSYVLFGIAPDRLQRMLLPVGSLAKREVRQRAEGLGLITAAKPDSQEICFVAPGEHPRLVAHRIGGSRAGDIVDEAGRVLGAHPGIEHFTIGQRQGLGIAVGSPLYVLRIEPEACRIVVGPREALPLKSLVATEASWIAAVPDEPFECLVQCRAQRPAARAIVTRHGPDRFTARFLEPTIDAPGPITPGQPAVCYDGTRLLGGGWICRE